MFVNGKQVIDYEIEVDYVHDYDDYVAYFLYATYADGINLTDDELYELTDNYPEVIDQYISENYIPGMADFLYD